MTSERPTMTRSAPSPYPLTGTYTKAPVNIDTIATCHTLSLPLNRYVH